MTAYISIDDTPLTLVDRTTLRERILNIPQEVVFFPDGISFHMNLDPFVASSEEDCWSVLDSVRLRNLVEEHGGLAAVMAVDMLSQGQKQLFSLARALLRLRVRRRHLENSYGEAGAGQQAILLLDEFSSGVDHDRAMQNIIREDFKAYTVVMVSHRLEMVMDFDTVVMMDTGNAVETGRPSTMIENEGSRFREPWLVGRETI